MCLGGIFDYDAKQEQLAEVELELAEPEVWNDPARAQALGQERASLETIVGTINTLDTGVVDARELLDMAVEDGDESALVDVQDEIDVLSEQLGKLEFRRMFSGETDTNNAYLDIQ
jgi:peptide chain release factor 2